MDKEIKYDQNRSLVDVILSAMKRRDDIQSNTSSWMIEHYSQKDSIDKTQPTMEILKVIQKLHELKNISIKRKSQVICDVIFGLGHAMKNGLDVRDPGRALGYAITVEGSKQNAYGMAVEANLVDPLIEAIKSCGDDTLGNLVARTSGVGINLKSPNDLMEKQKPAASGYLLAQHIVEKYPNLAKNIEVSNLADRIHGEGDRIFSDDKHRNAFRKLFMKGLFAWIENTPKKRFQLHQKTGYKNDAKTLGAAIVYLEKNEMLLNEDIRELGDIKAIHRLDKALMRSANLWEVDVRKWAPKRNEIDKVRSKIKEEVLRMAIGKDQLNTIHHQKKIKM